MLGRLIKLGLVVQVGVFLLLVGINNLADFRTNFSYVLHVMSMDTVDTVFGWRAITSAPLHHVVYSLIISAELAAGALCLAGGVALWRQRRAAATTFNRAKWAATAGLALAFSLWFFGFMVVGGEWFQMWRSPTWNGQQAAFRFIGCVGLVLIFLSQKDDELT